MSLSRLEITPDAALRVRIAGVAARISGLSPRIRADMSALLRPFVVAEDIPPTPPDASAEPIQVEIALRPVGRRSDDHDDRADHADAEGWEAWSDGVCLFRSDVYDRLLRRLEWEVVARSAPLAREWVIWHAAALSQSGRAITLVGASGAGKSTLTVALMRRGWRPLADDLTLLDLRTRTLAPFPRCFHVTSGNMPGAMPGAMPGSMPGASAASDTPLIWPTPALPDYARPRAWGHAGDRPTWLVVVRRDTAQPTSLTPITQAQAVGALFAATLHAPATASAVGVAAEVVGATAGCWELNNNNLETALDLLTTTLLGAAPDEMRPEHQMSAPA